MPNKRKKRRQRQRKLAKAEKAAAEAGGSGDGEAASGRPGRRIAFSDDATQSEARVSAGRDQGLRSLPAQRFTDRAGSSGRSPMEVILGLDLGTSSTKAVVRTPFLANGRALAAPIAGPDAQHSPYLAPTMLVAESDDSLRIAEIGRSGSVPTSLKVAVMDRPDDTQAIARLACFLALAARRARDWFLETQQEIVSPYELEWIWNLGIPSDGSGSAARIQEAFLKALNAASYLTEFESPIRLNDAERLVATPLPDDPRLTVVPEVVAEVVGYARSHFREEGLHILVDVGATTMDICGFILGEREGDDRYSLLESSVEPHGIHELHRARIVRISEDAALHLVSEAGDLNLSDPFTRIPESVSDYVSRESSVVETSAIDSNLSHSYSTQLRVCMKNLRQKRDRNAPGWKTGVPVFLCGGGCSSGFYRDLVKEVSSTFESSWRDFAPLRVQHLPLPPQLETSEDLDEMIFSRLAVAYGLSFDEFDIGEIIPSEQIPDQEPRKRRSMTDSISKDQV